MACPLFQGGGGGGGGAQQACHCWSSGRSGLASGLGGMRACLCRLSGRTRLARCQGLQALPLLAFGPQLACFWARGHAGLPLSGFGLQKSCPLPGLAGLATAGIRAAVGAASRLSGWLALVGLRATAGLPPLLGPRRACLHCWCACPPPSVGGRKRHVFIVLKQGDLAPQANFTFFARREFTRVWWACANAHRLRLRGGHTAIRWWWRCRCQ